MMESSFIEEINSGNFFDQIEDYFECPAENKCGVDGNLGNSNDCDDFSCAWKDTLPNSYPLFSGSHGDSAADFSAVLSLPYEDIIQLEWLSTFIEDSFSGEGMTIGKDNLCLNKVQLPSHKHFQTSSPVSVLESSSSFCSIGKHIPVASGHCGLQRARSKRPRPATFNPRAPIQLVSPSSSVEIPRLSYAPKFQSEAENVVVSPKISRLVVAEHKKKRKVKVSLPLSPLEAAQSVQKCLHCEITKTPQWRAGPMGPKTLCNACGVRYKSGRLFPEYRPAASPTFVPAIHSNSHKKVIEIRNKVVLEETVTTLQAPHSNEIQA